MKSFLIQVVLALFLTCCGNKDDIPSQENPTSDSEAPQGEENPDIENSENLLLRLNGTQIVGPENNPVYLQGVAFNNFMWFNTPEPPEHHGEIDYQRVKDMGMNAIRFYLNYHWFEDDANPYTYRQSGWDWLDQNIAWAKKYGIYLILNMHTPQGGYQSQGEGDALWENPENQERLTALWRAIAERYKNEPQIAGFGPVNEPVPTQDITQWNDLAQKLIDGIREVDPNHLLFIERAIYVEGNYVPDENLNFPEVSGENLVYEFHGYEPFAYTHQLMEFSKLGDGGKYPDELVIESYNTEWYTATFENPALISGTTDWTYFQGVRYTIEDENIALAGPALVGAKVGGRVYFDDIVIAEYDADGNFVRDVLTMNLSTLDNWNYWSSDGSGAAGLSNQVGHEDTASLYIEGASDDCNLSNGQLAFVPKMGYSYQINGWMKGDNVASEAACQVRLDFSKSDGPLLTRNRDYLETTVASIAEWGKAKNAALYMGEFGVGNPCFQNDKGGLRWVSDMVGILKEKNIPFTYHAYHEDNFGLYFGGGLPDPNNVNQPLIDWFTNNLR